jgi:hypothetical protein
MKRTSPWLLHSAVLGIFALLGVGVTLVDHSSGGMLEGVGTFYFWAFYVVGAAGTSMILLSFRFFFKDIRPWAALGLTYLVPVLVVAALVVRENIRVQQFELDRLRHRQALLDGCIDIVSWEVVPGGGGQCDLIMNVRSKLGAVVELRPFYRQWYGSQSVHRLPAGEGSVLRRSLELGRPSPTHEWIPRPETDCNSFDFRAFRFVFRCGATPPVVIGYQSSERPTGLEPTFGPAPTIKPLPASINETSR